MVEWEIDEFERDMEEDYESDKKRKMKRLDKARGLFSK